MMYAYTTFGLLLVVIILIYFLFRNMGAGSGSGGVTKPTRGKDITGNANSPLKKWDLSIANRQLILSDVPANLTPHLFPFNEAELRQQPLEGFKALISVAADIRLLDQNSKEVQKLEKPVKLWMSYNADDILALQKTGAAVNDLTPVKIVPGTTGWRRFSNEAVNFENINCGELGGVFITISTWGDPPTGWGIPR